MYLAPDGEELEITSAAAEFLAEAMPIARLHAGESADMGPAMRRQLGEMGWFALAVPEAHGGSGLSAVELALFFREAGRQCGPVDVLAQCLAANVAGQCGLDEGMAAGEVGVALLVQDASALRMFGHADAHHALLATPEGASLFAVGGMERRAVPALDPANSQQVIAGLTEPLASVPGPSVWQLGQIGTAAMLVGIAEASLDLIVEYARLRETFGRKIGSWQAVRHPCADMAVRAEAARSQLWFAAAALKEGRGDAQAHIDAAKFCANQAALANTDTSIQLHGGIGVTDEHDCHLLLKHAMLLSRLFGGKRALLANLLHAKLED